MQALRLLRRAASRGLDDAAHELASLVLPATDSLSSAARLDFALPYYHDRIWPVAIPLIQSAADCGEPLAIAILAQCAAEGIGVPYDYARAISLYAKAAAMGEPHAQFIMAETLQAFPDLLGEYPGLDAPSLYKSAAEAGVSDATEALAPLRP